MSVDGVALRASTQSPADEVFLASLQLARDMNPAQAAIQALSTEGVSPLAMQLGSATTSARVVVVQALVAQVAATQSTAVEPGTLATQSIAVEHGTVAQAVAAQVDAAQAE